MSEKTLDGWVPVWELFECDDGCRWAQLKDSPVDLLKRDGQQCDFSGCRTGHFIHKVKETDSRDEANGWFRDTHLDERLLESK